MKNVLVLAIGLVGLLLTNCSPSKPTLYIFNWTYYITNDVIKSFEQKYNVNVVYDVYSSNEEMFAKLKAGGTGYDIVVPSGDYVSIMISEQMADSIDKSKIPNFANLDTSVLSRIGFDPGSSHSVPYMMGSSGIAVNKKHVKDYERSWNIFARTDLANKMTLLDDMREVLGAALRSLGYSVNSNNPEELAKARDVVVQWKKNILKFDAEAFGKGFAAGEFWVVQGYAENVMKEIDSTMRPDVDFFIPVEGGGMYMDNFVILRNSKNKKLAYKFINYIHDPKIYASLVDNLGYPSINTAANPFRTKKPNYELSALSSSEFKEDIGTALELYNTMWQEIRVGK